MNDLVSVGGRALLAAVLVALVCVVVLNARSVLRNRRPVERTVHTVQTFEAPDKPNTYLVLCLALLDQLYPQAPGAATTTTSEEERESSLSGGAGVGGVNASASGKAVSRTRTTPTELTDTQKAIAVERWLTSEDQPTTVLDLIAPGDDRPVLDLLDTLRVEARKIELAVPDGVRTLLEQAWQEKSRSAEGPDLSSLGRYVSVRAVFTVRDGERDGDRELLATVWDRGRQAAQVRVFVRHADLAPPYDDRTPADGETQGFTCLGLPKWRKDTGTLELEPVYVYLS